MPEKYHLIEVTTLGSREREYIIDGVAGRVFTASEIAARERPMCCAYCGRPKESAQCEGCGAWANK